MYQAAKLLILVVPTVLFFAVDCVDYPDGPGEVNNSPNRAQQMKLRGAKENVASEDGYDIAFENHTSLQLFDNLRGKKTKCKTMSRCETAGGECTKRKNCDGKIKKVKNGCSKGCVCCITDGSNGNLQIFDCDNGQKIPEVLKCDGIDTCGDRSDEASCVSCKEGHMQCPNGKCIRDAWKCDGYEDCEDASDEENCALIQSTEGSNETITSTSTPHKCNGFECSNGRCIISSWKCDDLDDCGDNSDENNCPQNSISSKSRCEDHFWYCFWLKSWCHTRNVQHVCKKTCDQCGPACQCGVPNQQRIIGGTEVSSRQKYPWQVGLRKPYPNARSTYWYSCGGSIINDRWILTAAHCIVDKDTCRIRYNAGYPLEVVVGDHKQGINQYTHETTTYSIKSYIKHDNYVCNLDYDFGLLELTEPIPFNNNIRPICLPTDTKTYVGLNGLAIGWGRTTNQGPLSYNLLEVTLPILANNRCGRYGPLANIKLCAGGVNGKVTCRGDSGSSLAVFENNKYVLVGVNSYGAKLCDNPHFPSVFARVSKVLPWIAARTANGNKCN